LDEERVLVVFVELFDEILVTSAIVTFSWPRRLWHSRDLGDWRKAGKPVSRTGRSV